MRWTTNLLAVAMTVGVAACVGGGVRYYDADHRDYHRWNDTEITFYGQWESEGHRPHVDYARRSGDEQREYWNWRHNHEH